MTGQQVNMHRSQGPVNELVDRKRSSGEVSERFAVAVTVMTTSTTSVQTVCTRKSLECRDLGVVHVI